ncbi:aminotransferase class I/II-fold pyridoxal phosphate-dependent enzyme [Halobacillus salinarum]|uniref:Aminotransferase class I/II-fold pyridoxal phosphate-dependent enzyme n=1 Tax=Halobacillus salinarum TaxID=2932257 RepID=A0ABY4ERP8_9BACI|nr:GntG family PLP-dependent aldolase [Halobacillus salinarum]UOQ44801.1 aminotransferase class I/II-fold pyridoxal phosphate-dependent enzyme [Halobacillus salinarum]
MIDLRSDTVTKPTSAMRMAAFEAEVGDDVYGEDPTVRRLEEMAAEKLGKEAALFVTSGTQGNQIAILTHCQPGQEVVLEAESHLFLYEGAAMSAFAGVQPRTIKGIRGAMNPEEIKASIRAEDVHFPETGLICLENTHNKSGGSIVPLENMQAIYDVARSCQIPVHLDGARLFNAAVASGISAARYADQADTVQFCLSKGLGAPAGSIIAGSQAFITKARKWRKRLGGGLRQAGIIAAPGIVALTDMVERLSIDHQLAQQLAAGIAQIPKLTIDNVVETNMVVLNVSRLGVTAEQFSNELKKTGVLANPSGPQTVRFVTNFDVEEADITYALENIQTCARSF